MPPRRDSPTPDSITILIVDPHTPIREAMATLLRAEPDFTVLAAVSGLDEALGVVRRRPPRVTLVDLASLGHHRAAGLTALRATRPSTSILVTGIVDDPDLDREVARLGASARILKDAPAQELVGAVRAAGARRADLRIVPREP